MQVANYSLAMQTSHYQSQQSSVKESLSVMTNAPASPVVAAAAEVTLSSSALQMQSTSVSAVDGLPDSAVTDPKSLLLILLIERMTGRKVHVFDGIAVNGAKTAQASLPQSAQAQSAQPQSAQPQSAYRADFSSSYSESEQTNLQISGTVKTSDGQQISFSLKLMMQRQYTQSASVSIASGNAAQQTDPLVINFNGTAAQLSDQRFAFDLGANGQMQQINAPQSGTGFLALDNNGNGKIDNGSELFGPTTGNGFTQLASYDSDHNGWIDAGDPVFNRLQVWTKNADGSDQLSSLASLGVGAISLQPAGAPFQIKNAANQLLGTVLSTSVALNADGSTDSVQQLNLTA